jgi:parvulin-like peptidyl-prolyl isomerase
MPMTYNIQKYQKIAGTEEWCNRLCSENRRRPSYLCVRPLRRGAKRMWPVVILAVAILSAAGCAEKAPQALQGERGQLQVLDPAKMDSIILTIGEKVYRNDDFYSYLKNTAGEDLGELDEVALSRLYDDFLEEKILLHAAKASDIKLTEEEELDYFLKLREGSNENPQAEPYDPQQRKDLVDRLLIEKYALSLISEVTVTDEEIAAYYEENKRDFLKPERVKVSQILLSSEDKAVALYEELKSADEALFKSTAREQSTGVEAGRGGEMGTFELGQLPFEMEKVIFSLKEGEVSRVVESAYGFHIFRLDKRYGAQLQSAADAAPAIRALLVEARSKEFLSRHVEEKKNTTDWKSNTENLSFPYQRISDEQ